MRTARIRDLVELNPASRRFDVLGPEDTVAFVPMEGVTFGGLRLQERPKSAVATGFTRFEDGDVLIPKIAPTFSHGRVIAVRDLPGGVGTGTTELHVLRPRPGVLAAWLRYVALSARFLREGESTYYGVAGQKRISTEWLKNFCIFLPSFDQQRCLVQYLDIGCARIDELIAEQQRLMSLLLQRRRVSVLDAVTGGSVRGPRDSGLPWASSIPADWPVRRLTRVAELGSGHTPSRSRPELWEDCTIPWITTGEVAQIRSDLAEVLTETRERISELGIAESSATLRPADTVVLCRTAASAGFSALMGTEMATSQDFATWTCGPLLEPYFLLYCLRAMRPDLMGRLAMGSTHKTIYMPEIRSIEIPLPPVDEQRRIVATLRSTLTSIDEMRGEMQRQIDLLQEHKQALITAVVTGDRPVAS